jgi:hypothetical protein
VDLLASKSALLQSPLVLPWRGRGRPTLKADAEYQRQLKRWCAKVLKINSTLDFRVSSRGWCYILEEHGLAKGDFNDAQKLINDCRKSGLLPLDICSEDDGRQADHIEEIDEQTPKEFAEEWIDYVRNDAHQQFTPISFWDDLDFYLEMTVKKVDLKSLFSPECKEFHLPIQNISGWNDINSRVRIMRRFKYWESRGKKCVLLHCGDHDPGGLHISEFLRKNFADLSGAVGWEPDDLEIDRFGLNADFIRRHRLTWIDNLVTGSGGNLDDPDHNDHKKKYVQDYIKEFGARKVEANALVVRPEAGRKLCRDAILKYLPADAVKRHELQLRRVREQARREMVRQLRGNRP